MNIRMWISALRVIPCINKDEWDRLDIISKWLISTRSVVLVMTFISASIAGILADKENKFHLGLWLLLTLGLILAHATNNLINDYIDHLKGVDKDNSFRAQYGPQPLEHGLLSKRQVIYYIFITGLLALLSGVTLIFVRGGLTWLFFLLGMFFVIFYTFPLKFFALGELSVLIVWGPLMVAGGYYVITGDWNWEVVAASLPFGLGVMAVLFGKHLDKIEGDRLKEVFTLPVLLGEHTGRILVISLMLLQYGLILYLVIIKYFLPVVLLVLLALKTFFTIVYPMYRKPKPALKPDNYPAHAWPMWYLAAAFVHNRRFGLLFIIGLFLDTLITRYFLPFLIK